MCAKVSCGRDSDARMGDAATQHTHTTTHRAVAWPLACRVLSVHVHVLAAPEAAALAVVGVAAAGERPSNTFFSL